MADSTHNGTPQETDANSTNGGDPVPASTKDVEGNGDGVEDAAEDNGQDGKDDEHEDFEEDGEDEEYDDDALDSDMERPEDIPDEEKTPVTVVTGFLGAGKTTLVNYILKEQREMKIAVIENEYGAVSIDTALVQENIRENEEIITMDNGCVCCTVRGDLVKALTNLIPRRDTFDCILLETTGIADPSPIVSTFNQDYEVQSNYRIDSVLCLVDAKHITTQLKREPVEEGCVNEAAQQLAFADTVVVNKTDLVDAKELKSVHETIKSVNAFARVVESQRSRVPLEAILDLKSFNLERTLGLLEKEAALEKTREEEAAKEAAEAKANKANCHACGEGCTHDHDHKHDHRNGHKGDVENGHKHDGKKCGEGCTHDHDHGHDHGEKRKRDGQEADAAPAKKPKETVKVSSTRHDSQVGSLALTLKGSLEIDPFNKFMGEFLDEHGKDLFRSKGVLSFVGTPHKFVFQGVHENISCEPSEADWKEDGSDRESVIVFIGLNLDKHQITTGITACLAK